ncbi:ribosome-associated heat shock protein Hsp15 [Pseudoalteromonas sp. TAB23]|uniref:ribosome-associated heat shock protein Hsp15 n=1 Tax=Pseudoalteromonas sp. TAB23 TaxID=1938595 RepID=UPI00040CF8D9|nr:ribosome-associated heat shock protein Hsp15 [Pseudoalteromonas sp. TAB23]
MSKKSNANTSSDPVGGLKVRLDKWLWAARFYKTRAVAREMVQGGKVHYNGQRTKASKIVDVGAKVKLAQGVDEKLITILSVLEKRQSAPIAQTMYQESDASIAKREENSIARKNNSFFAPHPDKKPDKKQRRELLKMKSS